MEFLHGFLVESSELIDVLPKLICLRKVRLRPPLALWRSLKLFRLFELQVLEIYEGLHVDKG